MLRAGGALAMVVWLLAAFGAPAAASPTDRITLYGRGGYSTVVMHVFTLSGHDHTWGELTWSADWVSGCVWEDQTTDATQRTWNGPLRRTCGNGSTTRQATDGGYGSPLYDGPGYWVRVCGDAMGGGIICTAWN